MKLKLDIFNIFKKLRKHKIVKNYEKREAIISFIVWNRLKKSLHKKVIDPILIKKEINQFKNLLRKEDVCTLLNEVSKCHRTKNSQLHKMFRKLEWKKYKININSVGVVAPELGDLPECALVGDLSDTAYFVKNHRHYKSSKYIKKLTKLCSLLDKVPPIIIDSDYLNQRKKLPCAKFTKYYIEDGNHRAIAHTLCKNKCKITAFVGSKRGMPFIRFLFM